MEIVGDGHEESHILESAHGAEMDAAADLMLDLRTMVNNPKFSDVEFVCKDGKRVYASRKHLAGRSAVLQSMLMNGMAESNSSEIKSHETSSVLLSVFEFVYTGTLSDYIPQNWRMSCEVLVASQFFLLPKLEKITRIYMHAQIVSTVAKDLSKAAFWLTQAVEYEALCANPDVTLRELVSILSSEWSDPYFVQGLSEDALQYLLANSKGSCEDYNEFTFEEYLRFRQVIRWRVYQRPNDPYDDQESVNSFVDSVVPDEKTALSLCINFDSSGRYKTLSLDAALPSHIAPLSNIALTSDVWNTFLGQIQGKKTRHALLRLASLIDCRRIHPILLVKVVKPMKIVSAEQIMSSLSFHALRRPMIFKGFESRWEHGESYRVEQGNKIQRKENKIGIAVATAPMSRPYGVYKWRFILEETCNSFAEFGFIRLKDGIQDFNGILDGEKLSALDYARAVRFIEPRNGLKWRYNEHRSRVQCILFGPINFSYNASEHTCSFSLFGSREHTATWKELPSGTYYPAVCLGNSPSGCVRLELMGGFDVL